MVYHHLLLGYNDTINGELPFMVSFHTINGELPFMVSLN